MEFIKSVFKFWILSILFGFIVGFSFGSSILLESQPNSITRYITALTSDYEIDDIIDGEIILIQKDKN